MRWDQVPGEVGSFCEWACNGASGIVFAAVEDAWGRPVAYTRVAASTRLVAVRTGMLMLDVRGERVVLRWRVLDPMAREVT